MGAAIGRTGTFLKTSVSADDSHRISQFCGCRRPNQQCFCGLLAGASDGVHRPQLLADAERNNPTESTVPARAELDFENLRSRSAQNHLALLSA